VPLPVLCATVNSPLLLSVSLCHALGLIYDDIIVALSTFVPNYSIRIQERELEMLLESIVIIPRDIIAISHVPAFTFCIYIIQPSAGDGVA